MKTIDNLTAGNAFVAVKTVGEKYLCVVADKKHIGAVVAGLLNGTETFGFGELPEVRVVDVKSSIYKKISKITNDIAQGVTFPVDAKEIEKLAAELANEENVYDNNALIAGYTFGSFRMFVAEKEGQAVLVKSSTAAKKAVEDKLAEAGYAIIGTFVAKEQAQMIPFAAMNRANPKEGILNEYQVSNEIKESVLAMIPADEKSEEEVNTTDADAPTCECNEACQCEAAE